MTWHDGAISSSEVWIKLGGDKGHGSFKLNLQVVNNTHPNSIRNTTLLALFRAGDSIVNLNTALEQYQVHIEELQGMQWRLNTTTCLHVKKIHTCAFLHRDWKIRMFVSGGYEFHTTIYQLSGASSEGPFMSSVNIESYHALLQGGTIVDGVLYAAPI